MYNHITACGRIFSSNRRMKPREYQKQEQERVALQYSRLPSFICESADPCFIVKHSVISSPKLCKVRFYFGVNSDVIEQQIITMTLVKPASQSFLIGTLMPSLFCIQTKWPRFSLVCIQTHTLIFMLHIIQNQRTTTLN